MGSSLTEPCRERDATTGKETRHEVRLTHDFLLETTEVQRSAFLAAMGYDPSTLTCTGDCPVSELGWSEAAAYCNALSASKGKTSCYACTGFQSSVSCSVKSTYSGGGTSIYSCPGYRLPTEAEWEYAYRAGATTAFYNGAVTSCTGTDTLADKLGWYAGNSNLTLHPSSKLAANDWGVHDMAGNAAEFVHDWFQHDLGSAAVTDPAGPIAGTTRVLRGGYLGSAPDALRAAFREKPQSGGKGGNPVQVTGFRCAQTLP